MSENAISKLDSGKNFGADYVYSQQTNAFIIIRIGYFLQEIGKNLMIIMFLLKKLN